MNLKKESLSSAPLSILLVDDNQFNRDLMKIVFENLKHLVFTAKNGLEALELLSVEKVDYILLDMQMPVMDGAETILRIRHCEENSLDVYAMGDEYQELMEKIHLKNSGKHTLVIAISGHEDDVKEHDLEGKLDGYISKPFQPTEILALMNKLSKGCSF